MHLRFSTTTADSSKFLILESGCLASCIELAFFRLRPPEFLNGPLSLRSKLRDWFACGVNLYKHLCRSHNGLTRTIRGNYLSRKTQRDTFYQRKWILYVIVDSKPAENLIWDVLLFLIGQHWEIFQALSKLSEKKDASSMTRGRKSRLPNVLLLATGGKLALTSKRGHGKASGYFTAWKVTIKVDVKTSSLFYLYWNQLLLYFQKEERRTYNVCILFISPSCLWCRCSHVCPPLR